MNYVMDSGPLIIMFRHYYAGQFPTLWTRFDEMVSSKRIISVKEVSRELDGHDDRLSTWTVENKSFFLSPSEDEMTFVTKIFEVSHFQNLIQQQHRLQGRPVADPFVIAKAKLIKDGCVITNEKGKENAAKIPNVCDHFNIPHLDLEAFMEKENWSF